MKCPHCLVEINPSYREHPLGKDQLSYWSVYSMICPNPNCKKMIVDLASGKQKNDQFGRPTEGLSTNDTRQIIHPFASSRPPVPPEVETHFANDYKEACLILVFSAKASAALSRRCLQNI